MNLLEQAKSLIKDQANLNGGGLSGHDVWSADAATNMRALVARIERLEAALKDLAANGTRHDRTPTRRLYPLDTKAMECDEWWSKYFVSADDRVRAQAKEALQ